MQGSPLKFALAGLLCVGLILFFGTADGDSVFSFAYGDTATITTWPILTPGGTPAGILIAEDGAVWFTEVSGHRVGRLDPASGRMTEWPVGAHPQDLTLEESGAVLIAEAGSNAIGRLLPAVELYSRESVPTPPPSMGPYGGPVDVALKPPDEIWFVEGSANKLGRLIPGGFTFDALFPAASTSALTSPTATEVSPETTLVSPSITPGSPVRTPGLAFAPGTTTGPFTEWDAPSAGSQPRQVLVDKDDGTVWFTTAGRPDLVRFDPLSRTFTVFFLPDPTAHTVGLAASASASGRIWVTEPDRNRIARLDPDTNTFFEWIVPTPDSHPLGIAVAEDGTVWFTEQRGNKLARLDPATNLITEYPLPDPESRPAWLALESPYSVWFTLAGKDRIGRLTLTMTGSPPPRRASLGISVAAQATAVCGPTSTHQITISWKVSGGEPPLQVVIELTDPNGVTQRMGGEAREGEVTFSVSAREGGTASLKASVEDAAGAQATAQVSVSLSGCPGE